MPDNDIDTPTGGSDTGLAAGDLDTSLSGNNVDSTTNSDDTTLSPAQSDQVDMAAFQAVQEELKRIKDDYDAQKELMMLQRNQIDTLQRQTGTPQQQQSQTPPDPFDGMEGDALLDVDTVRGILNNYRESFEQTIESRLSQMNAALSHLSVAQQNPDYREVIEKDLARIVKENPQLGRDLESIGDPGVRLRLALEVARSRGTQQNRPPSSTPPSDTAKRIVNNASKSGVSTAAGGGGALGRVDYFKDLSDDEFEAYIQKVKNRG